MAITTPRLFSRPVMRSLMTTSGFSTRRTHIFDAPHQVLLAPPPPAPISSQLDQHSAQHQNSPSQFSYTFRSPTSLSEATLKQSVSALSLRLRQHHRFKVGWPIEHTDYAGRQTERLHDYLTNALVMPCLGLLSQLRAYYIKEPLQQISRNPEDGTFTVVAGGSGIYCIHPGVSIITITNVLPFPVSFPILIFVVRAMLFLDRIGFM